MSEAKPKKIRKYSYVGGKEVLEWIDPPTPKNKRKSVDPKPDKREKK